MCQYVVYCVSKVQACIGFFVIFHVSFPCKKTKVGFRRRIWIASLSQLHCLVTGRSVPHWLPLAFCWSGGHSTMPGGQYRSIPGCGLWEIGMMGFQVKGWLVLWELVAGIVLLKTIWVIDGYVQTRYRRASRIASCCHWKKHVTLNTRMELPKCKTVRENCHHHHLDNHLLNFNFGLRFVKFSIMTVQKSFLEVKSYGIA